MDAALQLLLERGVSAGVQHIRLQEVLRGVGLTSGAAYRIWADQDEFHRDLAVAMVELRFAPPVASATRAITDILESGGTMDDVIRGATFDHVHYAARFHREPESRHSHAFITALALRTAAGAWPELRVAGVARHRESVAAFTDFYGEMISRFGYRMREPFTVADFAEAMAALGEGFAVRAAEGIDHPMYEIEGGTDVPEGEWSLFGIAARGLVTAFMEPDPEASSTARTRTETAEEAHPQKNNRTTV